MSATEFAFLALGLVLGTATGAALVVVMRARPPAPREVRVTVAPPALARAAATLSQPSPSDLPSVLDADPSWPVPDDPPVTSSTTARAGTSVTQAGPASDSPVPAAATMDAPRALALGLAPPRVPRAAPAGGTPVRSGAVVLPAHAVAVSIEPAAPTASLASALGVAGSSRAPTHAGGALPQGRAAPPVTASAAVAVVAVPERAPDAPAIGNPAPLRRTPLDADTGAPDARNPLESAVTTSSPGTPSASATDPCAEPRRIAAERRELSERAAARARAAADALRAGQRSYDDEVAQAAQAERDVDPRAIRTAKDLAQRVFHEERARASTPDAREAAARTWLQEINAINRRHRDARATLERVRASTHELVPAIERLGLEADAARIAAESAAAASREAQEALATCEESAVPAMAAAVAGAGSVEAAAPERLFAGSEGLPLIAAVLRGDARALDRVAAAMAGGDPEEGRRWRLRMAALVDAITARAIEAAYLDFPAGHRFWGPFTPQQCRDIAAALASLGFRFDGLGSFVDERVPSQRDLSLAVGYAGLDPMRIRIWPSEAELPNLYREAVVAADQWLAEAGGDLQLGEIVDALGRRADELADVWNAWGRLRPVLLEDA